jgi:hypothetical protein
MYEWLTDQNGNASGHTLSHTHTRVCSVITASTLITLLIVYKPHIKKFYLKRGFCIKQINQNRMKYWRTVYYFITTVSTNLYCIDGFKK